MKNSKKKGKRKSNQKKLKKAQLIWKWKVIFIAVSLFISFGLLVFARQIDGFGTFYAQYIFPLWENSIGRLMSVFAVSVSEVFIYLILIFVIFRCIWILRKEKGVRLKYFANSILSFFVGASFLFFLYTMNCGINYYRTPFSQMENFEIKKRPVEELEEMCLWLTNQVNDVSKNIKRNRNGICILENQPHVRASKVMEELGEKYPSLKGYYPKAKPLMVSQMLSWQKLTGVYSPFTIEANYNRHMSVYNIPFTVCHELSHLKGFMREDEANFIAFLACISSDEIDFNYSGYLLGWIYGMNALYKEDAAAYKEIRNKLAPEIEADLLDNQEFWDKYDGKAAKIAQKVNDTYLKINDQKDGVKSYDRVVDLMLSYYEKEN